MRKIVGKIILPIVIIGLAYVISKFFFQLMLIQGDSMLPTYHNLQLVILNKYDRNYVENDVIAFRCDNLDAVLVKRIVKVCEDGYYVLGDNLEESVDSRDERIGIVSEEQVIGKVVM